VARLRVRGGDLAVLRSRLVEVGGDGEVNQPSGLWARPASSDQLAGDARRMPVAVANRCLGVLLSRA
jgi:hypothetical protein